VKPEFPISTLLLLSKKKRYTNRPVAVKMARMRGARYARGFWRMPELHPHYGVKLAILRLITRLAMRPTQIDRPMKSR